MGSQNQDSEVKERQNGEQHKKETQEKERQNSQWY